MAGAQVHLRGWLYGGRLVDGDVALRGIDGLYWRQTAPPYNPFIPEESAYGEGRYHRKDEKVAWYGAGCEMAAWAELQRLSGASTEHATRYLSCVRVRDVDVLDLTDSAVQGILGNCTWGDLCADDYDFCQSIASVAFASAVDGLLAPSAALPGHSILVLRREVIYESRRVEEQYRRIGKPPATLARLRNQVPKRAQRQVTGGSPRPSSEGASAVHP
ncbi:RES family NAD+ phosphorylase [Streptomyces sp. NPDC058667]|uniref:RES family NAD+ phosphorylase n=1 Tax=Streptomyces sp. NPDC058667 TaxID=3346588 RepID=UPI00365E80BE